MTTNVSVTRDIAASPAKVWEMLSDLPRMGEWSPENTGGKWVRGATGPAVGARFVGSNRNGKKRGPPRARSRTASRLVRSPSTWPSAR